MSCLLLGVLVACGNPEEPEPETPGIRIIAGASVADTVATQLLQALVIEVQTAQPGTVVRFEATVDLEKPYVLVSSLAGATFGLFATDTVRANGRASVRVTLGHRTGDAFLHIVVPEFGLLDSASYTVLPGAATGVRVDPPDTAVGLAATFSLRGAVIDQFGNPRADPVAFRALGPELTVLGAMVTARQAGRGRVEASAGPAKDTAFVSVVPTGLLSAVQGADVVVFHPDGTIIHRSAVPGLSPFTADWSPDGSLLVLDSGAGGPLRLLRSDGTSRTVGTDVGWSIYPEFSADGEWVYYSNDGGPGWSIRRVRPSGMDDSLVYRVSGIEVAPSLSPDGRMMAFTYVGDPDRLAVLDLGTGVVRDLGNGHTPAWRPQGDYIAFFDPRTSEIFVIRPDGAALRRVSELGRAFGFGLDWSPDGAWLVARSSTGLVLIEFATRVNLLLPFTQDFYAPAWSRP